MGRIEPSHGTSHHANEPRKPEQKKGSISSRFANLEATSTLKDRTITLETRQDPRISRLAKKKI